MRVEIWSDVACPWCYVGKRRIGKALSRFEHAGDVAVVWRSFQLDPSAPAAPDGEYAERLSRKYRIPEREAVAIIDRMTSVGASEGIDFRFDRARPGNTFDAHRLLHLAARHDLQDQVNERLLSATFSEGAAISDRDTLARLGAEAGLDADETRAVLAGDEYGSQVRADLAQARAYGITAVPFFVFDGRYGVPGAQPADVLLDVLRQVWTESSLREDVAAASAPGCEGEACGL